MLSIFNPSPCPDFNNQIGSVVRSAFRSGSPEFISFESMSGPGFGF